MKVFCRKKASLVIQGKTYNLYEGLQDIGNPIHAELLIAQGLVERVSGPRSPKLAEVVEVKVVPKVVAEEPIEEIKEPVEEPIEEIKEPVKEPVEEPVEEPIEEIEELVKVKTSTKSGQRKQIKK